MSESTASSKKSSESTRINLRLPTALLERAEARAATNCISRDRLLRDALTGFLDLLDRMDASSAGWVPVPKEALRQASDDEFALVDGEAESVTPPWPDRKEGDIDITSVAAPEDTAVRVSLHDD